MAIKSPKLVLDENVVRFVLSMPATHRRRLLAILEHIRQHFSDAPDYIERDSTGRNLSVVALHPFLVTYWLDGAVDELRIVDASLAKP